MNNEITYEDRIGLEMIKLDIYDVFLIDEKVRPANRAKFIEIVKSYIDRNFGKNDGWQLTFNSNYTKIRKDRI